MNTISVNNTEYKTNPGVYRDSCKGCVAHKTPNLCNKLSNELYMDANLSCIKHNLIFVMMPKIENTPEYQKYLELKNKFEG